MSDEYLITYGEELDAGETQCLVMRSDNDLERQIRYLIDEIGIDPETIRVWESSTVRVVRVEQPKYVVEGLPVHPGPDDQCGQCGHRRGVHRAPSMGCSEPRCGCGAFR